MSRSGASPADLLDLLVQRAPALRAAGVRSVTLDGLSAEIDPPTPTPPKLSKRDIEAAKLLDVPVDPLDDPMSYPGGYVPRRVRPEPQRARRQQEPTDEHD